MPSVEIFSPSRIRLADKCGLAYDYHYHKQIPAPYDRARTVFGTVVHRAVEQWYGEPGSEHHKTTSLPDLIAAEWWEHLPRDVAPSLRKAIAATVALEAEAALMQIRRPEIKQITQTKQYLTSQAYKRCEDARDALVAASDKCAIMKWPKTENALQAYQKSITIGTQLEARWKPLPRPLVVEHSFTTEFAGMLVRGTVDQVRIDPIPGTDVVKVEGLDIKTGAQMMTQMEAFIQAFIYHHACVVADELPTPDFWTFWMARHNKPQHGMIDYDRHARLAERIMRGIRERVEREDFAPHYGFWCERCDFKELCEAEINMWPVGEQSMTLGITQ